MRRKIIGGLVAALLVTIVILSWKGGGGSKGPRVYAAEARRRTIARTVIASGEVDPRVKVNISSHLIARIERLYVKEGERIEAGAPFLDLEKEAFVAARDRAAAELEIAQSRLRQAEIDLEDAELRLRRMERLHREQIASAEQHDAAKLARISAELRLEQAREGVIQARASLAKAEDDLSKTTIYAPLTGRVIELKAEEGEVVVSGTMNNPASVIGTIADLSELLAEVDVDETEIVYVALGQAADLEVDALPDRTYAGHVVEIGSSGFSRPQQPDVTFFKVKVLFDDPDAALRPGMSVRAAIQTAEHPDAIVIPIEAVVDRPPLDDERGDTGQLEDEVSVVFVREDGEVHQREVETGISDATHVEILSGLEAGESVVTGPYRVLKDLKDGDAVRLRAENEEDEENGS